jgi:hypothetical protein
VLCQTILVPLVDTFLEQVKTLPSRRDVKDHEKYERERDSNRDRDADFVKELEARIRSIVFDVQRIVRPGFPRVD